MSPTRFRTGLRAITTALQRSSPRPARNTTCADIENAMRMTAQRRALYSDLIGIRALRGLTGRQVADAIGVPLAAVTRFESDPEFADPTVEFVLRYAHAVGAEITMRAHPVAPIAGR